MCICNYVCVVVCVPHTMYGLSIPDSWSTPTRCTCSQKHPGVCAQKLSHEMCKCSEKLIKTCTSKTVLPGQLMRVVADHDHFDCSVLCSFSFAETPFGHDAPVAVFLELNEADGVAKFKLDVASSYCCAQKQIADLWTAGTPSRVMLHVFPLTSVCAADAGEFLPSVLPECGAPVLLWPLPPEEKADKSARQSKFDAQLADMLAQCGLAGEDGACEDDEQVAEALAIELMEKKMGKTLATARRQRRRKVQQRAAGRQMRRKKQPQPVEALF